MAFDRAMDEVWLIERVAVGVGVVEGVRVGDEKTVLARGVFVAGAEAGEYPVRTLVLADDRPGKVRVTEDDDDGVFESGQAVDDLDLDAGGLFERGINFGADDVAGERAGPVICAAGLLELTSGTGFETRFGAAKVAVGARSEAVADAVRDRPDSADDRPVVKDDQVRLVGLDGLHRGAHRFGTRVVDRDVFDLDGFADCLFEAGGRQPGPCLRDIVVSVACGGATTDDKHAHAADVSPPGSCH